jgi:hypothetical protein
MRVRRSGKREDEQSFGLPMNLLFGAISVAGNG